MIKKITEITALVKRFVPKNKNDVEIFRIKYLGKRGILNQLFEEFKNVPVEEKKEIGRSINDLKEQLKNKILSFDFSEKKSKSTNLEDLTKKVMASNLGSRHPLSIIEEEIVEIFSSIGFCVAEGPEIENDWYNFSALNTPEEHPARDMQDTFFIQSNPSVLLRSHTSSVQVRHMENNSPPIRILSPGRVYRNEAISSRAHCLFHQIEGLYIDKDVNFADLKKTLLFFAKKLFWGKF